MRNTLSYLLLAVMINTSLSAFAGDENNNGNNQQVITCTDKMIIEAKKERLALAKEQGLKTPPPRSIKDLSECEKLNIIAISNKNGHIGRPQNTTTVDRKYRCVSYGGFTVDFDDCLRVKSAYDQVALAEMAMLKSQEISINEDNIKQTKKYTEAQAQGDGQNAAIDATIHRNKMNSQMYNKQALTYSTAVSYLGTMISVWQGKKEKGTDKRCRDESATANLTERVPAEIGETIPSEPAILCSTLMKEFKENPSVYANNEARVAFLGALATYLQKAADARKRAGLNEDVAERMKKSPLQGSEESSNQLDKCVLNPTSIDCVKQASRGRTGTSSLSGSSFGAASGAGGISDFNLDGGSAANIGDNEMDPSKDPEKVADIASPFEAQAKEASGILDPADKAIVTPGSAPGGGGGGGGGIGGGGGGALGDDLAGAAADENKDPDITTSKFAGKYGKTGGSGFSAVGKGKDETANPFASMFDAKGGEEGGIEEDRSIASDEDGEASGLFEKISRKYGQIQADKRVESQNLE